MAFEFTMRSAQSGSGHTRNMPSTGTLPAISEDGNDFNPPPVPQRAQQGPDAPLYPWSTMSFVRAFERSANRSPPSYSFKSGVSEEETEKGANVREKKQIAKRGGWRRLALVVLIIVLCLIGLIVGLVVGLRKPRVSNSPADRPSNPSSPINTTFPSGSYGIQTFLNTISTNCTSNSATWRCYPYSTYSDSPIASAVRFDWFIQPESEDSNNYTISSTNNPFSLSFTNVTMTLVDTGLSTERYTFRVDMNKPVVPTLDISGNNVATTCYFNKTVFEADLYTKQERSYPPDTGTNNTNFVPWPYATNMKQLAASGNDVPECFSADGVKIGDFSVTSNGDECSCNYQNYGQ